VTYLLLALLLAPPSEFTDRLETESDAEMALLAADPLWPLPALSEETEAEHVEATAQDLPAPDQDPLERFPKPRLEAPTRVPDSRPSTLLSIDAQGWMVTPRAWLFITKGSEPGSATRAHDERQIDFEPRPTVALGATLRLFEPHAFRIEVVRLDERGRDPVQSDFIYHGTLYPAGRQVETRVDLQLADLDYLYTWRPAEGLMLTVHAGIEYWNFASEVRTVDGGPSIDEKRAFSSAFAKTGVDSSYEFLDGLAVRGSLLGGLTTSKRYFYDVQFGVEWKVSGNVSLTVGYRLHDVRFHQSTNEADLQYAGPTAGLELRF